MNGSQLLSLTLAICTPFLARADCQSLAREIQDASRGGDIQALARYADRIPTEPSCPDAYRPRLARVAAYGFIKEVQRRIDSGAPLSDQEALLRQSLAATRTWQALAMLGDLSLERKRYGDATALYQEALGVIDDPAATPKAPPESAIRSVFRKAAESRLLAESYVAVPVNHRSGAAQGLALEAVRGWEIEQVPIPITFEMNSTRFSVKGEAAARDLSTYLKQQRPAQVTIVGHTDARGTSDYNRALSRRRAAAVASFLQREGYDGRIFTQGMGESQPIRLDDPARYSREEIWRLNRRVELVR